MDDDRTPPSRPRQPSGKRSTSAGRPVVTVPRVEGYSEGVPGGGHRSGDGVGAETGIDLRRLLAVDDS